MIKDWLENHWVAGALFMAVALLLLASVVIAGNDRAVLLIYLTSAVYMIHQVDGTHGQRQRQPELSRSGSPGELLPQHDQGIGGVGHQPPLRIVVGLETPDLAARRHQQ
jgi:hypothetical protein